MHSYMEQKEVPSFANEPAERYCTNVWKLTRRPHVRPV